MNSIGIRKLFKFAKLNMNLQYFNKKTFVNYRDKDNNPEPHSHKHHKHHEHNKPIESTGPSPIERTEGEALPNINITKDTGKSSVYYEQEREPTEPKTSPTRKIHGNMVGMERIDGNTGGSVEEIKKEFLKDESKTSNRPTKGIYIYTGNLNTENNSPTEKDITDDTKTTK